MSIIEVDVRRRLFELLNDEDDHNALQVRAVLFEGGGGEFARQRLESTDDTAEAWTPLHLACAHGLSRIVHVLFEFQFNSSQRDASGRTALHVLIEYGRLEDLETWSILEMLLRHGGGDANARDAREQTAFHYAVFYTRDLTSLRRFVSLTTPDVHAVDAKRRTALHYAGEREVAAYLIDECGLDVHAVDAKARTPLMHVTHSAWDAPSPELVALYLARGVSASQCDFDGLSAVENACCAQPCVALLNVFFERAVALPATALLLAVGGRRYLNRRDIVHATLMQPVRGDGLVYAEMAFERRLRAIAYLIRDRGTDIYLVDDQGKTAFDLARLWDERSVCRIVWLLYGGRS